MPSRLSVASAGMLLDYIRSRDGVTRQDLLARSGMSRSTLYTRLDLLEQASLIYEAGQLSSTGGRPATVLRFDDRNRIVLTFDIGHHEALVSVCSMDGATLLEQHAYVNSAGDLAVLVNHLAGIAEELLRKAPGQDLVGIGAAIPAPINTRTGLRWRSVAMPDDAFPIKEELEARFARPVCLENDARALALGALRSGEPLGDDGVLLAVKYSTGIGAGLLLGGQLMRGSTGSAGDIGHMRIRDTGPLCTCGNRGCLAATASGRAIVRDIADPAVQTVDDVIARLDAGDPVVQQLVETASRLLGRTLATLAHTVNPQYIRLSGTLGRHPRVAEWIAAGVRHYSMPRIHEHAQIDIVDERATTVGLVRLVGATVFSPEQVDRLTGGDEPQIA